MPADAGGKGSHGGMVEVQGAAVRGVWIQRTQSCQPNLRKKGTWTLNYEVRVTGSHLSSPHLHITIRNISPAILVSAENTDKCLARLYSGIIKPDSVIVIFKSEL